MTWVPSLYFVQGLQFFVVMLIAGLMFKNMGEPNDRIARWTGVLGLAWAFKPLWSPFLELARSKKSPDEIVEELYLSIYARLPDSQEREVCHKLFADQPRRQAVEDLMWSLINTPEFLLKD